MNEQKLLIITAIMLVLMAFCILPAAAYESTTELTVVKYDTDGETILEQLTVPYEQMRDEMTNLGDGSTHYYFQGITTDPWDPSETDNLDDMGAVKGTDVKDLCDAVGGMTPGDEIKISSGGSYLSWFGYDNVCNPDPEQGPMGIAWYSDGLTVPDYIRGMRLVFFAETPNADGKYVFGNNDMRECLDVKYQHFYSEGAPSSKGLSVKNVDRIEIYSHDGPQDVLFDGGVTLTGGNFTATAGETSYKISRLTPLGALDAAAESAGFEYEISDKKIGMGILMLDKVGNYDLRKVKDEAGKTVEKHAWSCSVNGVVLDDFENPSTDGLNLRKLQDGDQVVFFYGDTCDPENTPETAAAVIRISVTADEGTDCLFDGEIALTDEEFTATAGETSYKISRLTPLGALDAAAESAGLTYKLSNKLWDYGHVLLLDDIGDYTRKNPNTWTCYVNGVEKDSFKNKLDGLNVVELKNDDQVNFYYIPSEGTTDDATAVVKITIKTDSAPTPEEWSVKVTGRETVSLTKTEIESAVTGMGGAEYTDGDGTWKGLPLWYFAALVDGGEAADFDDKLAAEGYNITVTGEDGQSVVFESADIARNNGYILANTFNDEALPVKTSTDEPCWPLMMTGENVISEKTIGNISEIKLTDLPEPRAAWKLAVNGVINDTITQAEFEEGNCHRETWTAQDGNVWSGVPLWYLVAVSDNIETGSHWTFDDDLATEGYSVEVIAADGFSKTFASADIARNNHYIVADTLNGGALPEDKYPLRLVGSELWNSDKNSLSGKSVGSIAAINLAELIPEAPAEGSWNLELSGNIDAVITEAEFEEGVACHGVEWTDRKDRTWKGIPMWYLAGWVDDRTPHGGNGFSEQLATNGYKIICTASDGHSVELTSSQIKQNNNIIVANSCNGSPLEVSEDKPLWPLRIVGSDLPDKSCSVGGIVSIELTEFGISTEEPSVTIVKYGADRVTEISNVTKTCSWMKNNLKVWGDGEEYRFEGLCFAPSDMWDRDETYPGSPAFKISNAVQGTSVKDLCHLAGDMVPGTEIRFISTDKLVTTLNYSNIYEPKDRQGECVLAWHDSEMGYVPEYKDGPRLFFMPEDHIFGQWDMHECINMNYWHYNSGLPSCAGISAKYVNRIEIFSVPEAGWKLELDGAVDKTINKGYFENGLACTMAGNHKASYTDHKDRVWEGMPLWLLCGFVDDTNSHRDGAFNQALAEKGYKVHVIAGDGSEAVIDSRDMIRNSEYIIANTLNGLHMTPEESSWPLRLVGEGVTGDVKSVKNVVKIVLEIPEPEPHNPGSVSHGGHSNNHNIQHTEETDPSLDTGNQADRAGNSEISISGATLSPETEGRTLLSIDRAASKASGQELTSDEDSIRITREGFTLTIQADEITQDETAISGRVTGVGISSETFTSSLEGLGDVGASYQTALISVPSGNAAFGTSLESEMPESLKAAFTGLSEEDGTHVREVAYILSITETNIPETSNATIMMSLPDAWVESHGGCQNIRILRMAEDNSTQILTTTAAGHDENGSSLFSAESPDGLCHFGIAAMTAPETPEKPTQTAGTEPLPEDEETGGLPVMAITGIILLLVVIGGIWYYSRSKTEETEKAENKDKKNKAKKTQKK